MGEPTGNGAIAMEVDSGLMMLDAVAAGRGIGELPTHVADGMEQLVRIWPRQHEAYDIWPVMHADLHRTARVRTVADAIVEVFGQS